MNRGVCTGPWGVMKQPQRARLWGQRAVIVKLKGAEPAAIGAARSPGTWGEGLVGTLGSPGAGVEVIPGLPSGSRCR